ncbi:MAG: HNH endonuclease [Syntrophorhabdus sp.]|nr:HNH endonuclease [Syntrophorhabdus sp.]
MVEVHHIIPQAKNGPDEEDNAVVLCPSCHELYGDNPKLRKRMREKRDWWFRVATKKFPYENGGILQSVQIVDDELRTSRHKPESLPGLRRALDIYIKELLNFINPENAKETAELILDAIPLDTGILLPESRIAAEGFCECGQKRCAGHRDRMYCYWDKELSPWVIAVNGN